MFNVLANLGKVATLVGGANPAIAGIAAALEVIEAITGDDDVTSSALYMELAADMSELSAAIIRASKNGLTKVEREAIIEELKKLLQGVE